MCRMAKHVSLYSGQRIRAHCSNILITPKRGTSGATFNAHDISVDDLIRKVKNIGDQQKGCAEKLVFSYADIDLYKKVKVNTMRP